MLSCMGNENGQTDQIDDKIDSKIIQTVRSKEFGIIGHLVIDRLIGECSFGGVRIDYNTSLSELQLVARKMTYKNAFIGNRIGGAKAVVIIMPKYEKYRKDILLEFGKEIGIFIRRRMYFPVLDMGITPNELQIIFNGANYRCDVSLWKDSSHEYTAYSCFYSTLCALKNKGIDIRDVEFAVQGFGRVGSTYANLMCKAGARLVALSNKFCGIISENDGFDIEKLKKLAKEKGDDFILTMDRKVPHDNVLEKDVTILLPAANTLVINNKNWDRIGADIIICAANAPMSHDIERKLFDNNKIVITDFIANCGGILGSIMDNYVDKNTIIDIISNSYKRKVESLLDQSTNNKKPFVDIVTEDVEKRIQNDYILPGLMKKDLTEKIICILQTTDFVKNLTNGYLSKKYKSRYDALWT